MYPHGRYLKFRHVMPELFGPSVQARRGLLRLRWFLLQRLDFRPIWTLGAAAGLGGVLLTVALFFLQGNLRPLIAARESVEIGRVATFPNRPLAPAAFVPAPVPYSVSPWIPPAPTSAATIVPQFPSIPSLPIVEMWTLTPYLAPELTRLVMPFGWDDRRPMTVFSTPQAMEPTTPFSLARNDRWSRPSFRSFNPVPRQSFVPYREPLDYRWNSVTPDVRYSSVVSSSAGIGPISRPYAIIEKVMPTNYAGKGPLEYRLVVRNPSQNPLPDVSVFEAVDVNRVTAVNPPARVEPTGLVWKLAGLAPGERRELTVSVWTEGLAELAVATEVELADRVAAVMRIEGQTGEPFFERAPVPAVSPAIDLPAFPRQSDLPAFPTLNEVRQPVPPPASSIPSFPVIPATQAPSPTPQPQGRPLLRLTAEPPSAVAVGEDATTWYQIENIGDAPATDIVLRLRLANGLQHHDGSQDVEFGIPRLDPGEKRRARLVTRANSHGLYDVSGQLTSGEQQEQTSVQLFAPQRESVAGETEPATDSRRAKQANCNCTLLVRQTTIAGRR